MGYRELLVSIARIPKYSVILLTKLVVFCKTVVLSVLIPSSSQLLRIESQVLGCCDSNPDTRTVKYHKNYLGMPDADIVGLL